MNLRLSRFEQQRPGLERAVAALKRCSRPLTGAGDLDALIDRVGDARYVLLGEASHGTHEYYAWRAEISRRLIEEKGFSFIAVEGDWPDCCELDRFIKGRPTTGMTAREVLYTSYNRWPTWMWANREIEELAVWLRRHNDGLPEERRVGFYGLDVYSLYESMRTVIEYLDGTDAEAAREARWAYRCFEPYAHDPQQYAWATRMVPASCEEAVVSVLTELRRRAPHETASEREARFNAEQNALTAKNAELYYRTMIRGGAESWNVRDRHMAETLDHLMRFHGPEAKAIVWAHNTHVGDARATDMLADGMFNIGQLVREQHAAEGVVLVGFSTYEGSVIAGREWGAPMEEMTVPPARSGTWDALYREAALGDALTLFPAEEASELAQTLGQRAIGVVYRPEYEAFGNYVPTSLSRRYDALLYLDRTRALSPLHVRVEAREEAPETYPSGV
jgi:erythromycin esterase